MPCFACDGATYSDRDRIYCLACDLPEYECRCEDPGYPGYEVGHTDDSHLPPHNYNPPTPSIAPCCVYCHLPIRARPKPHCRCVFYDPLPYVIG